MASVTEIDASWLAEHPLPTHQDVVGKDDRGHVLTIGGSTVAPGGILLAAEAAARAGAGRVQVATIETIALAVGIAMPEAGVFALPEDEAGEIAWRKDDPVHGAINRCDCVLIGPAMTSSDAAMPIVQDLLAKPVGPLIVLDAAAIKAAVPLAHDLCHQGSRVVLTPNPAEMAYALQCDVEGVVDDPGQALDSATDLFGTAIILKGPRTFVSVPGSPLMSYPGGGVGLAASGSGDVLAGMVAGLLARGASTQDACAWGVWLHGEAGRTLADTVGPLGFLAREVASEIPRVMARATSPGINSR